MDKAAFLRQIDEVIDRGPFSADWRSLEGYTVPTWYRDAKLGIFLHWGVYSVPAFANEWYPRNMYRRGTLEFDHHVATYGPHRSFGYKDFIPQFKAERWDPAAWADLFARSGARYVVPVAEHHDGFAMYDCPFSRWTAAKMGPRRDIVGELGAAVRARGLTLGVSSHRAEHWFFMNGGRAFDSDVNDPAFVDFYGPARPEEEQPDIDHMDDWLARCCDLVDRCQPQVFWFDWWIEQPAWEPYLRRFAAYYYNRAAQWGKGVAINFKEHAFPEGTAVYDVERGQLGDIRATTWQTDTSVSKNSWCWIRNHEYKTTGDIVRDLVDIVAKNGVLLLNLGPKPDGTIPEPEQAILEGVGRWLAVNGEAIYGSRPWKVYGEGPTAVVAGTFNDTRRAPFTAGDFRFTRQGDTLYVTAMDWPASGRWLIRTLATGHEHAPQSIAAVTLLGGGPLRFTRTAEGLSVEAPPARPEGPAFVMKTA